jgi:hypothetical protein
MADQPDRFLALLRTPLPLSPAIKPKISSAKDIALADRRLTKAFVSHLVRLRLRFVSKSQYHRQSFAFFRYRGPLLFIERAR